VSRKIPDKQTFSCGKLHKQKTVALKTSVGLQHGGDTERWLKTRFLAPMKMLVVTSFWGRRRAGRCLVVDQEVGLINCSQ
jgi:hypothetical protein